LPEARRIVVPAQRLIGSQRRSPVSGDREKTYTNDTIAVRFNPRRCIHSAECVFGLPTVFDPERVPWIDPAGVSADTLARVVARCPTGALHAERRDGGPAEAPDPVAWVRPTRNGPLHLRGAIEVRAADGSVIARDVRVALCRCGGTQNPPFCDNSHRALRFVDAGEVFEGGVKPGTGSAEPGLHVTLEAGGPYRLTGEFEVVSVDGRVRCEGGEAALCRCGSSRNKPFCDGSHRTTEFPPD
jgi:CDGSH-type Zn-finger protein/uncharacterized Fe-S cluster protein YjdI